MDLESALQLVDERVLKAASASIKVEAWRQAILDGMAVLTEDLRKRSGEHSDGAQLVGSALGGAAPKVRLSELRTPSEEDEQNGFQDLVRGLYRAIRNPRTHDATKFNKTDTVEDAARWLVAISAVLQRLKSQHVDFDVNGAIARFKDPAFVEEAPYSNAVVETIPASHRVAVAEALIAERANLKTGRLRLVANSLYGAVAEEDRKHLAEKIGVLLETSDEADTKRLLSLLRGDQWQDLPEVPRRRAENMVIQSIREGLIRNGVLEGGGLGTWAGRLGPSFIDKDGLARALINRLGANWYTQNYVGKHLFRLIAVVARTCDSELREELMTKVAYSAASNNARQVQTSILESAKDWPPDVRQELLESLETYHESNPEFVKQALDALRS